MHIEKYSSQHKSLKSGKESTTLELWYHVRARKFLRYHVGVNDDSSTSPGIVARLNYLPLERKWQECLLQQYKIEYGWISIEYENVHEMPCLQRQGEI